MDMQVKIDGREATLRFNRYRCGGNVEEWMEIQKDRSGKPITVARHYLPCSDAALKKGSKFRTSGHDYEILS